MIGLMQIKGGRAIFSVSEVAKHLTLTIPCTKVFIRRGSLYRCCQGKYCLRLKDVNEFIVRLNAGEVYRVKRSKAS